MSIFSLSVRSTVELLQSPQSSTFTRSYRRHTAKVLCSSLSNLTYLDNHTSGSIHIWTIGTHSYLDHRYPGALAFIPWLLTPCPGVGLEVKIWDTFKKCFSTFLLWKQLRQIVGQTSVSLVTLTCGSWGGGHHDQYFTVQWFCLISWRLFDVWTSYFGIMSQYNSAFDLKINAGHCDLYFMVQWFCLISWRLFDVWTSYFRIMSQDDPKFDLKINEGHCDLYLMVQWFCIISWRLFYVWTAYFRIMSQYDTGFDCKTNVGHCDLYFKVHWFCLISWRLFDVWTLYFGIMSQYDTIDTTFDLKINVGHCDIYFKVQWFCLISWRLCDVWTSYFDMTFDLKITVTYISWSSDLALYLENYSVAEHNTLGLWVSMTWRLSSKYL